MLSNVLPGLREVRAPLTAGYIWLIAAWLLFHSSIPTEQEARGGPLEPFFDLGGVVSSFGFTVVLSVLAYLIGSLSEGVFLVPMLRGARVFCGGPSWQLSWKGDRSLTLLVQDRVSRASGKLADAGLSLQQLPEYEEISRQVEGGFDTLNRLGLVYAMATSQEKLYDFYFRAPWARFRSGLAGFTEGSVPVPRPTWFEIVTEEDDEPGAIGLRSDVEDSFDWNLEWNVQYKVSRDRFISMASDNGENGELERMVTYTPKKRQHAQSRRKGEIIKELTVHRLAEVITWQVTEDMPLVGTRLLGKETELFHEFDRQRGKSSFRLAIIPPLLVLTIVLAIEVDWVLFTLLGSVPLFYWQGVRYRQEASDVLIDSLVVGRVEAPAIEKLERAADRAIALRKLSAPTTTEPVKKSTDARATGSQKAPGAARAGPTD